jgi:hypothetical protein
MFFPSSLVEEGFFIESVRHINWKLTYNSIANFRLTQGIFYAENRGFIT